MEYDAEFLVSLYREMVLIRQFEERVKYLFLEGLMPGTIHQYHGQEAIAVGVCRALEREDVITSTHRPHGHAIARGLSVESIMHELFGKTTGCCRGKGGSMHIGDLEKGMVPAIAIVGGGVPVATGIALAFKMRKEPRVAVCFMGDGAVNQGAFHEALRLLARLLEVAETAGANGYVIEILVLQALAQHAQRKTDPSLNALERALSLAEPQGYVRIFVDEGASMAPLLRQTIAGGIAVDYAGRLLATLESEMREKRRATTPAPSSMVEPLSERELEVLRLLTTHLSSTEIAQELLISANTVRSHIKSIYGKLSVHSRKDAVQRARELEVL